MRRVKYYITPRGDLPATTFEMLPVPSSNPIYRCEMCCDKGHIITPDRICPCPQCRRKAIINRKKKQSKPEPPAIPAISDLKLPCEICFAKETNILYPECRHILGCHACTIKMFNKGFKCPVCEKVSKKVTRVFIS